MTLSSVLRAREELLWSVTQKRSFSCGVSTQLWTSTGKLVMLGSALEVQCAQYSLPCITSFQTETTCLQCIEPRDLQLRMSTHLSVRGIARKKCYSYTLCCKTGNTDNLSHAGNAWEPRFLPVFPYDFRITSFPCHTEKICDAETPTNV